MTRKALMMPDHIQQRLAKYGTVGMTYTDVLVMLMDVYDQDPHFSPDTLQRLAARGVAGETLEIVLVRLLEECDRKKRED